MHWWYLVILFGVVAYFGYRRYMENKRKKQSLAPKCETCGTPMELQTKLGGNEIWECPECNPNKD